MAANDWQKQIDKLYRTLREIKRKKRQIHCYAHVKHGKATGRLYTSGDHLSHPNALCTCNNQQPTTSALQQRHSSQCSMYRLTISSRNSQHVDRYTEKPPLGQ